MTKKIKDWNVNFKITFEDESEYSFDEIDVSLDDEPKLLNIIEKHVGDFGLSKQPEIEKAIEEFEDEDDESYIVDLGSLYISKSKYKTLENWDEWLLEQAKEGNIEIDQVLTEDGDYPEEGQR